MLCQLCYYHQLHAITLWLCSVCRLSLTICMSALLLIEFIRQLRYTDIDNFVSYAFCILFIPPATKLRGGGILDSPCLSVCSLTFPVCPVASTVQDGFFPYLVQMINSMRGCVACDDPWPWPKSSRSFGFDLENRVRSVASAVLDGFFLRLAQMITIIRGCVACYFFSEPANLNFWQIFKMFWPWPWKKKSTVLDGFFPYLAQMITSMRGCVAYNDLWPWPLSSRSFGLENRVRSVTSTVPDGVFPYLVQMITSMRRYVACDDLWPWPISSRSFDLDLENHVRSVGSAVLDGFFLYLAQTITIIRGCVVCYVFCRIWKFEFLAIFWNFSALTLKKIYSFQWILCIFSTNHH